MTNLDGYKVMADGRLKSPESLREEPFVNPKSDIFTVEIRPPEGTPQTFIKVHTLAGVIKLLINQEGDLTFYKDRLEKNHE